MLNSQEDFWVIIPAAGKGQRFNADLPKQYLKIFNKTILEYTISLFLDKPWVKGIVIALPEEDEAFISLPYSSSEKIETVKGGEIRAHSVENALRHLKAKAKNRDWILTHDAVRPCLHEQDLNRLVNTLVHDEIGGILGAKVPDTVKFVEGNEIAHTLARENCWLAQTPQMFRLHHLLEALVHCRQKEITVTDEAQAIELFGLKSKMVSASYPNPKLTLSKDKAYIELLLQQKQLEVEETC